MIEDRFPRPERDAGSVLTHHYVQLFQDLGYHVHFVATHDDGEADPYRQDLAQRGVTVLDASSRARDVVDMLEADGSRIDVAFLSRVHAGGSHLEEVRRHCRDAPIIFNTVDLHFLREERAARLAADRVALYHAAALREREIHVARQADATLVVSSAEQPILESLAPGARVVWCPLIQDPVGRTNGFAGRSGMAFIGGYRHGPNVDAVTSFLDDIWPSIRAALPGARFYAIGADMPPAIRDRTDDGFVPVGHVVDLAPWLERVRLTVAPLRYGAGLKGKVLSSLACGVPSVVTGIAAEGMPAQGAGIVVADEPDAFTAAVVRLHEDAAVWMGHSDEALRWIESTTSTRRGRERLRDLLAELGAPIPTDAMAAPG
jgi:glycosyltransferase involved in cell wall biosynthesis